MTLDRIMILLTSRFVVIVCIICSSAFNFIQAQAFPQFTIPSLVNGNGTLPLLIWSVNPWMLISASFLPQYELLLPLCACWSHCRASFHHIRSLQVAWIYGPSLKSLKSNRKPSNQCLCNESEIQILFPFDTILVGYFVQIKFPTKSRLILYFYIFVKFNFGENGLLYYLANIS